jgi:rubrerythrin
MDGGISAWNGLMAKGAPDAGIAFFTPAHSAEQLLGLSWILEDGSRRFYSSLKSIVEDNEARALFEDLLGAEESHKAALSELYRDMSNKEIRPGFPWYLMEDISPVRDDDIMEGGMSIREALQWSKERSLPDVLELLIALETNAYDLYIKLERSFEDLKAKQVFKKLFGEEKRHLERLTSLLDARL